MASRIEWQNRAGSLGDDAAARALADDCAFCGADRRARSSYRKTIDNDGELRGKRDLLLSIDGVEQTVAAVVLAELPAPDVMGSSSAAVAYAGPNPRPFQSGPSVNRPTLKQILIAAMRKLLMICFGALKSGRAFDAKLAMPAV